MRFFGAAILLTIISYSLHAQPLAKSAEFIHWYFNISEAQLAARQENKTVVIYFSGSDWCKPCIQLREKIINSQSWITFADQQLIMVQADFPRLKKNQTSKEQLKHNEALAEQYNKQGEFPLVVIIDGSGQAIGKINYHEQTPDEFIEQMKAFVK
ncbi:MAG TPA: thioredoxin family protein [Cyclobacteriaceae bacterium]|jgi:thioredoxin-related protein|nr:thioredoxin family protein [Cyclobacteriaceae bacterium]